VTENSSGLSRFDGIDLASIEERVKHLGIIGHSRGYIYKVGALLARLLAVARGLSSYACVATLV
jgi:hypothetical protein